jgi:hypothetical protein
VPNSSPYDKSVSVGLRLRGRIDHHDSQMQFADTIKSESSPELYWAKCQGDMRQWHESDSPSLTPRALEEAAQRSEDKTNRYFRSLY